ncbi:MAG: Txe/YoeB family addiction module toxin [Pelagerythrobacter marensis]|nr:MAG: Txe/YoeB family addiction module toxin [Pelagerythrobacter marensis]
MRIVFSSNGWEDYRHWCDTDVKELRRLNRLIEECRRQPFAGPGKPEALRHELSGCWSRRLNLKDRLVYRLVGDPDDQTLEIIQCRGHY